MRNKIIPQLNLFELLRITSGSGGKGRIIGNRLWCGDGLTIYQALYYYILIILKHVSTLTFLNDINEDPNQLMNIFIILLL